MSIRMTSTIICASMVMLMGAQCPTVSLPILQPINSAPTTQPTSSNPATTPETPPTLASLGLTCAACHSEYAAKFAAGVHKGLSKQCLACHENSIAHQNSPFVTKAIVRFSLEQCAGCHQEEHDSYLHDDGAKAGKYGGSVATSKYLEYPHYQFLMGGHGFTIQYNEERAHRWMLKDHIDTKRKQATTCLQCKSTAVAYYWNESRRGKSMFDKSQVWSDVVQKIKDQNPETVDYGAGCNHCHDPHTGQFRLIRKGVIAGILSRGTDPYAPELNVMPSDANDLIAKMNERGSDGKLTEQARRLAGTLTCAQCHIEYVCGQGADKLTTGEIRDDVGWRKLKDVEAYYLSKFGNQQDWKHSVTGLTGVKPQHPETETYWNSHHHKAGLSCADCHMEKTADANGKIRSNHFLSSPLKQAKLSCSQCHPDSVQIDQVMVAVQDSVYAKARRVEDQLNAVLLKIQDANTSGAVSTGTLNQAKSLYMRGLTWWEWTAVSENSMGVHNWEEARTNLDAAEDFAKQAAALLP